MCSRSRCQTIASSIVAASLLVVASNGFVVVAPSKSATSQLHMGLFDGVKEAFSAPALERSTLDAERETPIDRWMGWSVVSENQQQEQAQAQAQAAADFVDAMDEGNYVAAALTKPMGIVFEENDSEYGGIFVQSLKEGGAAAVDGTVKVGDQLVAVNTDKVYGMAFDDALGTIIDAEGDTTKLVLFRGSAKQFYGPTGASKAWLDEFVAKGGVAVAGAKVATEEPKAEEKLEEPKAEEPAEEPKAEEEAKQPEEAKSD